MFMLRCIFWLSVMFASLPVGSGILGHWQETRETAAAALDLAATQASAWCAARPAQCMHDARRLTALVSAAAGAPEPVLDGRIRPAVETGATTRHRAVRTMLTDGR